jgi:hypothetical protein
MRMLLLPGSRHNWDKTQHYPRRLPRTSYSVASVPPRTRGARWAGSLAKPYTGCKHIPPQGSCELRVYKYLGRRCQNNESIEQLEASVYLSPFTNACIIVGANQCGSGGIGRRASLRSWWPKGRRGSSPFFRRCLFRFECLRRFPTPVGPPNPRRPCRTFRTCFNV